LAPGWRSTRSFSSAVGGAEFSSGTPGNSQNPRHPRYNWSMATVEIPRQTGVLANERTEELLGVLQERVLVLDGATGTGIQARNLTAADFGGPDLEGCNENLVRTRPDVVRDLHAAYFDAGADMVETNTFGGTPLVLAEYGLADKAREINREAARIAREAAALFRTPGRPRFVAGSMGPTTKSITVTA
jgi:5-methyltetrahydrofolate--homocysteine methyltransferase